MLETSKEKFYRYKSIGFNNILRLLGGNYPTKVYSKGDTIQYIYIDSQHKDPLRRVVPLEILQKGESSENSTLNYDKEKYREMILDAAETVLGDFGFDRTVYENPKNNRKKNCSCSWKGFLRCSSIQLTNTNL
jgi:hypothetical protein